MGYTLFFGMKLWYKHGEVVPCEVTDTLATSVIAVMGKRGSGKTYFAGVLEEELAEKGIPFIVLDPMRAHYTIRERYNVLIAGSEDTPFVDAMIDHRIGGEFAELVCEGNLSVVVDLSWMPREKQEVFVRDLCWRLLEVSRTPRMIILEEADAFAPQMRGSESREAVETLIRRGRAFGLGATIISQRPAIVSKDALSQADVYLFFRLIAPRDIEAVRDILSYAGASQEAVKEILSLLPRLYSGEAVLYSPEKLETLEFVRVRERVTTHAAETPSPTSIKPTPSVFSDVASRIQEIIEARGVEETEMERLRRLVREYEEKLRAMEEELKEYKRQVELLKTVREIPIKLRIPPEASVQRASTPTIQIPEAVRRCPYRGAVSVFEYLLGRNDYASLKDINTSTGVGLETVRKIIRYFKKKGIVQVKTLSIHGRQYIRQVKLKPS